MSVKAILLGLLTSLGIAGAQADEPHPQRWVSAGGSLTEWIVALGGEKQLVGVDTTSLHPDSLKSLPRIGYQRQLAAEGILSLRPDILLGSEEMGPPPVLQQLRAAGVRVEVLPAKADEQVVQANLKRLGELLDVKAKADEVAAAFSKRLEAQAVWVRQAQAAQPAPRVLLLVGSAGGNVLVAGKETSGDWLIGHAGGQNLAQHQGYKSVSSEALTALNPEVILVADRSLEGDAARAALLQHNPGLAATSAAREGRLLMIDPTLLVGGLGPRIPDGLAALSRSFYPSVPALVSDGRP